VIKLKKLIILLLLSLFFINICYAIWPKQWAFRDLFWGDSVSKLGDVIQTKKATDPNSDGTDTYTKKEEILTLGLVKLNYIKYIFWQDLLMEIIIDGDNAWDLSIYARANYGTPLSTDGFSGRWVKNGISCVVQEMGNGGVMLLKSYTVEHKYDVWKREQEKKNSSAN
jgi:hypothetical protein